MIVFHHEVEAHRIKQIASTKYGIHISIVISNPCGDLSYLYENLRGNRNRVIFDHTWLELYYENRIKRACLELDTFFNLIGAESHEQPSISRSF